MYRATDEFLTSLKTRLNKERNYWNTLSFDELNVVRVAKETKEMFKRFLDYNYDEYIKIAKKSRAYALTLIAKEETEYLEDNDEGKAESYVEYILKTYNPVTGYLYKKEAERKRLRASEEISTAKVFLNRTRYRMTIDRTMNLWFTQSGQYAIDLTDYVVLSTLKEMGVEKVQWVAEDDGKTCKVCRNLDGRVFDIDSVPNKVHYHCRCHVIPYKDIFDFVEKP
jgi:hypothetical protein